MTAKEAEAAVKVRYPKARCWYEGSIWRTLGEPAFFQVRSHRLAIGKGGPTRSEAWKAAAAALGEKDG